MSDDPWMFVPLAIAAVALVFDLPGLATAALTYAAIEILEAYRDRDR